MERQEGSGSLLLSPPHFDMRRRKEYQEFGWRHLSGPLGPTYGRDSVAWGTWRGEAFVAFHRSCVGLLHATGHPLDETARPVALRIGGRQIQVACRAPTEGRRSSG